MPKAALIPSGPESPPDRLESVANAPPVIPGATLDLPRLTSQIERVINNQAKQQDDFNYHIHLFGRPRAEELAAGKLNAGIVGSDTPVPQVLKHLRDHYETKPWLKIEDPSKALACQNQILKMITDIVLHMEARHDKGFESRMDLVREYRASREHEDRMRVAEKTGDQALSDEELLARAAELRAKRAKAQDPDA